MNFQISTGRPFCGKQTSTDLKATLGKEHPLKSAASQGAEPAALPHVDDALVKCFFLTWHSGWSPGMR